MDHPYRAADQVWFHPAGGPPRKSYLARPHTLGNGFDLLVPIVPDDYPTAYIFYPGVRHLGRQRPGDPYWTAIGCGGGS